MNLIVVTGTGTGVGKTIATAALVAIARANGQRLAVVKPLQTGVGPDEPGDLAEVQRLTGHTDRHEFARFAEPLAPATAARRLGQRGPTVRELAQRIGELADRDLVVVEGAGGLLVRFNQDDETLLDLIEALVGRFDVCVLLVAASGLGVLNSTALTALALVQRGLGLGGVVVGDWPVKPDRPDLAQRCNLVDLSSYAGADLVGILPSGAGRTSRTAFAEMAVRSFTPAFGGTLDVAALIDEYQVPPPSRGRAHVSS